MAGTIKTNVQLGDSTTASQNFTLSASAADGTMKLSRGNAGATTQDILTVDANGNVNTSKGLLGYAESLTSQLSISSTAVDLTGLSVTVNVLAGQRLKITGYLPQVYSTVATDRFQLSINEGAVVLTSSYTQANTNANGNIGIVSLITQPSAGSHTYKLTVAISGTGTATKFSNTNAASYILVEAI